MKKTTLLSTALLASLLAISFPGQADMAKGERIFKQNCATCHGKQGEKKAFDESRVINQLNSEEIFTALQDRKAGKIEGAGNRVKSRLSEQNMKDLAEFVPTLK
ncbi:c-type cytochrome [Pasteurellaceae bacterium LIM206]|nr:c-type cytochrome [Pasteurellaceae bacterium LIM206]